MTVETTEQKNKAILRNFNTADQAFNRLRYGSEPYRGEEAQKNFVCSFNNLEKSIDDSSSRNAVFSFALRLKIQLFYQQKKLPNGFLLEDKDVLIEATKTLQKNQFYNDFVRMNPQDKKLFDNVVPPTVESTTQAFQKMTIPTPSAP